jgi:hypothetical protein
MKYAFIMGSSAFVVPNGVINYSDGNFSKEILRVRSIYHDDVPGSHLSVDLDIDEPDGNNIRIINNVAEQYVGCQVTIERNRVKVLKADGTIVIDVQQMDDESAMALQHNIVAELEVNTPIAVIRIFGDFKAGGLNISAENEKLFVNHNGYATSALAGKELQFTTNGVVL